MNVIKTIGDFIISDAVLAVGNKERLTCLHKELINKDWFMTLLTWKTTLLKGTAVDDYASCDAWLIKSSLTLRKQDLSLI